MADIRIRFFGWAHNPNEGNDKIWGWVEVEGKLYNFWGRRGTEDKPKNLSFKRHPATWDGNYDLKRLADKKMKPGGGKTPYRSIPCDRAEDGTFPGIDEVYPGFSSHFGKQLMFARLAGIIRNDI